MKKRILVLLTVLALMVVMLAMAVGSAFAALPNNPSGKQQPGSGSYNSNNCAGEFSAQVSHNGFVVRTQDRQVEVRRLQACNNANQK